MIFLSTSSSIMEEMFWQEHEEGLSLKVCRTTVESNGQMNAHRCKISSYALIPQGLFIGLGCVGEFIGCYQDACWRTAVSAN